MSIIKRQRKHGIVYLVCTRWKGKKYYERSGTDRREAERINKRRRAEVKAGTFQPRRSSRATFASYTETWLDGRRSRNADNDASILRRLVLSREWLAGMQLEDVRKAHAAQLLAELRTTTSEETGRPLSEKYIANVIGLLSTMYNAAVEQEIVPANPFRMKRGAIRRRASVSTRAPYELPEIAKILGCEELPPMARVFAALALFTGMREGEVCGRRWRDLDPGSEPLGCLTVASQYNGQPLKTEWGTHGEHPRRVPVHPDLERVLAWWKAEGFALQYGRSPTPDDFIVPQRSGASNHTRSSAYKMWRRALATAGVGNKTLHATRHSFITHCRRGGAPKDIVERVTHNSKGDIVDQYTHIDWDPLCAAVLCLGARPGPTRGVTHPRVALENTVEAQGIEVSGRDRIPSNSRALVATIDGRSGPRSSQDSRRSAARGDASSPFDPTVAEYVGERVLEALPHALSGDEEATLRPLTKAAQALATGSAPTAGGAT